MKNEDKQIPSFTSFHRTNPQEFLDSNKKTTKFCRRAEIPNKNKEKL